MTLLLLECAWVHMKDLPQLPVGVVKAASVHELHVHRFVGGQASGGKGGIGDCVDIGAAVSCQRKDRLGVGVASHTALVVNSSKRSWTSNMTKASSLMIRQVASSSVNRESNAKPRAVKNATDRSCP